MMVKHKEMNTTWQKMRLVRPGDGGEDTLCGGAHCHCYSISRAWPFGVGRWFDGGENGRIYGKGMNAARQRLRRLDRATGARACFAAD